MHRKVKVFIGVLCLLFANFSFLFYISKNKSTIDGLIAPIHINIELEKKYYNSLVLVTKPHEKVIPLVPTCPIESKMKKIVIYTEVINEYIQGISIRIPQKQANSVITSIENISIFIGNKLFYFNSQDISGWNYTTNADSTDYIIPLEMYKKSFIKPWINWYGDLNYVLKEIIALITSPNKFIFVYFFILIIIILFSREIFQYCRNNKNRMEIIFLFLLIVFSLLLRIDPITRHSAWLDELYSATIASNPNNPIDNTFRDPGNPPLYYIILRIWFSIFGWHETTGRLLSVLIGTGSIIFLYWFVKSICGRKHAFVSAFLLIISSSFIGHSIQMRNYILMIMLVPLTSKMFVSFLQNQTIKKSFIYAIFGILLVNTHYYGILLIFGNFIFYLIFNRNHLELRKIIKFSIWNFIIALSIVPYFFITAFKGALLNEGFNSWIPKLGKMEYFIAVLLPFFYTGGKLFIIFSKKYNIIGKDKIMLLDYSSFLVMFIYLTAFLISLYRPILIWRYLVICLPIILTILPIFIIDIPLFLVSSFHKYSCKLQAILGSLTLLILSSNFLNKWNKLEGWSSDVFKESQQYIVMNAKSQISPAQSFFNILSSSSSEFYGLVSLPVFLKENNHDVVYINPLHVNTEEMNNELVNNNINPENVLKIRISSRRTVYKAIMENK